MEKIKTNRVAETPPPATVHRLPADPCRIIVLLPFFVLLFALTPGSVMAQAGEGYEPDLRKWTLQINAGSFMGNTSLDATPFMGTLGSETRIFNPAFGASLEYALSTSFSLSANYYFSLIENDSGSEAFENQYHSLGIGLNLYLAELLQFHRVNHRFNPYASVILGHSYNNLSGMDALPDDSYWFGHYGFGLGARINLGERVDWNLGYQYKMFNFPGIIDGGVAFPGSGVMGSDRLAGFTTGLSIKLGSTSRPHSVWYTQARQTDDMNRRLSEMAARHQQDFEELERRIREQNAAIEAIGVRETPEVDAASRREMEQARQEMARMQSQIDELENRVAETPPPAPVHRSPADPLPPGYYVQTFASRRMDAIQKAMQMIREGMTAAGMPADAGTVHIYTLPGGLHTVQVGPFGDSAQAERARRAAATVFDDSYIVRH